MDLSLPAKSPALALELAELVNAVSVPQGNRVIDDRFQAATGAFPVSVRVDATNFMPAWYAGRAGDYSLLLIAGCSTMDHSVRTIDGFRGSLLGPVGEPVNEYFRQVGEAIRGEAQTGGFLSQDKVVIAGHSLGGAAAEHVAASLIAQGMGERIKLVTFGAPKPGGAGFAAEVAGIDRIRWFCADDPVGLLPPTADLLPSILLAQTPVQLMRFSNFVHPRGGCEITVDSLIGKRILPELATINATASLAGWLLAVDGSSSSAHHLTTYQARLAYYLRRLIDPSGGVAEVAAAEEPADDQKAEVTRQQRTAVRVLAEVVAEQAREPVAIPATNRFSYQKSGKFHLVTFNGTTVVATARERSARAVAREGNEFLRRLQSQGVVMVDELAAQFASYLQLASSAKGGFTPTMNRELPELPS